MRENTCLTNKLGSPYLCSEILHVMGMKNHDASGGKKWSVGEWHSKYTISHVMGMKNSTNHDATGGKMLCK